MDQKKAQEMIGKIVLVGVTARNRDDEIVGQEQYFGRVLRISEAEGLIITCGVSGKEIWMPPAMESYEQAAPGEYKLRSSGQVVTDPDYIATFTRYPPVTH